MKAILYKTTPQERKVSSVLISQKDSGEENEVLNIYEELQFQKLEGFGGALTDAAGYVFSRLSKEQQEQLLAMYFDEGQMGYNRVRIPMDSCDFATHVYEADADPADENLDSFSFADTERYILPLLEAAEKRAGKKLKLMLSAWSPPAYMKTNHSRMKGGSLKPEYKERWAQYLCRYIREFQQRGFKVERISVQNEPKAAQTWDSCIYTAQEEKEFLRDYLVPALKEHGMESIEIFIWDHNKERIYERVHEIVDDSTEDLVAGAAFHWYSGDHFEALDLVRQQYPNLKMILSESCLEFGKYEKEGQLANAQRLAHDMIGNLNHGMVGFYDWNILLDQDGGPNHVGNFCDAPYLYDLEKKTLTERTCLDYYWHFAHFIKPGAVRLAHTKYADVLDLTAWRNPDGTVAAVFLNKSEEQMVCNLRISGEIFSFFLEAHSIASCEISKENMLRKEENND